jgi:hypothetical protein
MSRDQSSSLFLGENVCFVVEAGFTIGSCTLLRDLVLCFLVLYSLTAVWLSIVLELILSLRSGIASLQSRGALSLCSSMCP